MLNEAGRATREKLEGKYRGEGGGRLVGSRGKVKGCMSIEEVDEGEGDALRS